VAKGGVPLPLFFLPFSASYSTSLGKKKGLLLVPVLKESAAIYVGQVDFLANKL